MTHTKFYTKLLLLILSLLLLVSCTNVVMPTPEVSEESTEGSKTESQIFEEILSQLPSVENSEAEEITGQPLTILTPDETVFLGDESAAGSIQNALVNRNELLLSAYGMEVLIDTVPEDEIFDLLAAAVESGVAAGDLLCYSARTTATLFAAGLLQDVTKLPYFDLNAVCLDPAFATELAYRGEVYALPDPSAQSSDEMFVTFYDRDLVEKAGLTRPEVLVQSGKWTYDAFLTYAETIAKDVMNSASHDLGKDIFGYSSPDNTNLLPSLLWSSGGESLFAYDEAGDLYFPYDTQPLRDAMAVQIKLYNSQSRYPLDGTDAHASFMAGRLGFLVERLDYLKELYAKSNRSYGILPMPKKEGADGYSCPVTAAGRVLSAPKLMKNPAKTGLGLSALCTAGGLLLREAEKETYVTLYSADNDQSCMLEIILDSQYFDFATFFEVCDPSVSSLSTELLVHVVVDNSSRVPTLIKDGREALAIYLDKLNDILHPPVDIPAEESREEAAS